jgi:hypothetical protein
MAGFSRVNGQASYSTFYGYQPLVLVIADSGNTFTASSGGSGSAITDGGYEKAVRAVETLGSIIWLGKQANGSFTAIVDGGSFNAGPGATTSGAYGALKDNIAAQTGASVGNLTVTTYTTITGAGAFAN